MDGLSISVLTLWLVVLTMLIYLVALTRQVGILHLRLGPTGARMTNDGLDIGETVPNTALSTMNGNVLHLQSTLRTILIFVSTNCPACRELIRDLRRYRPRVGDQVALVFNVDEPAMVRSFLAEAAVNKHIPAICSAALVVDFSVSTVPYGFAIDQKGRIRGKGMVNNLEHIESLENSLSADLPSLRPPQPLSLSGHPTMQQAKGTSDGVVD